MSSYAFRVYNKRTKIVMESVNIIVDDGTTKVLSKVEKIDEVVKVVDAKSNAKSDSEESPLPKLKVLLKYTLS